MLLQFAFHRGVAAADRGPIDFDAMLGSIVSIKTINTVETDYLGDTVWATWWGSGIVVSTEPCEVWTNYHNVSKAAVIEVRAYPPKAVNRFPAQLLNADSRRDLAILHLENCPGLKPATLGDSDAISQGETVFAVGNPSGRNPGSISRGIISHANRLPVGVLHFVQTDAAVCSGSSGGGLFNRAGELIAMNSALLTDTNDHASGFAYAVPVNALKKLLTRLRTLPPTQVHLGLDGKIANLEQREASQLGVPQGRSAVVVTREPDAPPTQGLLRIRDVIYQADGVPIESVAALTWLVGERQAGDTTRLSIVRSGQPTTVTVPVTATEITLTKTKAEGYEGYLGLRLEEWGEEGGEQGYFKTPVITAIINLGPAHLAGIRSSQHYLVRDRAITMPYLMEVRTITGVFENQTYRAVYSANQLEQLAAAAVKAGKPLVVEVQLWLRSSPKMPESPFLHDTTTYHTLQPKSFVH